MRRLLLKSLVIAAFVPLISPLPVFGQAFAWSGQPDLACNVEQWTTIVYGSQHVGDPCPGPQVVNNPLVCTWDRDDSWALRGEGDIPKGSITSGQVCDVADGTVAVGRNVDAEVFAGNDKLVVTLATNDGRSWNLPPVRRGNGYVYGVCTENGYPGQFPSYPEIAGSNGGHGVPVTYTLTIDATSRAANNARAIIDVGHGIWSTVTCGR
jgi:hypothetical protein